MQLMHDKRNPILSKRYGIGLHRYNPAKFPGTVFLDVADAQYNPLNPEEIATGPTGTNVADICLIAVEKAQAAATARHR